MNSTKINKHFYPEIVEIDIDPNIIFPNDIISASTLSSANRIKKTNPFHKKINSETSNSYSQNILRNKSRYQSRTKSNNNSIQTPEINTRYRLRLEKLNSSISSLKNKYSDLIKQNFNDNKEIKDYKIRFIELKKKDDKNRMKEKKQKYLNLKNLQKKENHEKMQKIKEEYHQNKTKEKVEKIRIVNNLKNKEKNNLKNYQKRLIISQMIKKQNKEQEKKCIEEELINQKKNKMKEIKEREKIKKEKEQKKAEEIQGNQVLILIKEKNELESKIKTQKTINDNTRKQYVNIFKKKINNKCFINSN